MAQRKTYAWYYHRDCLKVPRERKGVSTLKKEFYVEGRRGNVRVLGLPYDLGDDPREPLLMVSIYDISSRTEKQLSFLALLSSFEVAPERTSE